MRPTAISGATGPDGAHARSRSPSRRCSVACAAFDVMVMNTRPSCRTRRNTLDFMVAVHPNAGAEARASANASTALLTELGIGVRGTSISGQDDRDEMGFCFEPARFITATRGSVAVIAARLRGKNLAVHDAHAGGAQTVRYGWIGRSKIRPTDFDIAATFVPPLQPGLVRRRVGRNE